MENKNKIIVLDIEKITLEPDDVLVVTVARNENADEIKEKIHEIFKRLGYENDVILKTPDVSLSKVSKEL